MDALQVVIAVAAGIVLFLFGIEHFSREVQVVSGERFRRFLAHGTRNRFLAFLLGGVVTAVVQSSTATSVIAVGLVNAGVVSFRSSLGVIFGANVGTTVTAQLVALELTSFAPALILVGFAVSYAPFRWRVVGRSIFYFGLVFFSLDLVSAAVKPLASDPETLAIIARFDSPMTALLAGALFTAVVQSSTVTTGVAIVLLQRGIVPFGVALPLVLGANIGTTITALIASASLDTSARRTAVSHALYNVGGVLLFLPVLPSFTTLLESFGQSPASKLATAHLVFNLTTAALFLAALGPFAKLVEWMVHDEEPEEPLRVLPKAVDDVQASVANAEAWSGDLIGRLGAYYTASVLALETQDKKIYARAVRAAAIVRLALDEIRDLVSVLSKRALSEEESLGVLRLVVTRDHVRQILDSIDDIMALNDNLRRRSGRLSIDALLPVQAVFTRTANLIHALDCARANQTWDLTEARTQEAKLEGALEEGYLRFIELARMEREGSDLADFLSIHQRLRAKLLLFGEHLAVATKRVPYGGP